MTSDSSTLLFVYGTLMRGGCRARALAGQRFLGDVRSEPRYRLFDCGTYPGLVDDVGAQGQGQGRGQGRGRGRSIVGELWEVDGACLRQLDRMEGVDEGLYERRPIRLLDAPDGRPVQAYFYLPSTDGLRDCGVRWINAPKSSQQ